MPNARDEDNVVWLNPIANNVAAAAEANEDLPNPAILDGFTDFGKMLDSLQRSPDRPDGTRRSTGILDVEKFTNPFDIRESLGRE
jgi:hypothetical protein